MRTKLSKGLVWLIQGSLQSALLAGTIKRVVGTRRLFVFSSLKQALRRAVDCSRPECVFFEGNLQASDIRAIKKCVPDVPLFSIVSYADAEDTRLERVLPTSLRRYSTTYDAYRFTIRERQILELMVRGLTKKEIADHLSLSFHSVNNRERGIFAKLGVHTRSAAVAKVLMEDLV